MERKEKVRKKMRRDQIRGRSPNAEPLLSTRHERLPHFDGIWAHVYAPPTVSFPRPSQPAQSSSDAVVRFATGVGLFVGGGGGGGEWRTQHARSFPPAQALLVCAVVVVVVVCVVVVCVLVVCVVALLWSTLAVTPPESMGSIYKHESAGKEYAEP